MQQDNNDANQSLIMKKLFAIDISGSVMNVAFYHENVKKILEKYYQNDDAIIVWTSNYQVVSKPQMDDIINRQEGREGTDPSKIAQALVDLPHLPHEHIIIITDGHVDCGSIQKTDDIINRNDIHFDYATVILIEPSDSNWKQDQLSVGIPFCRSCPCDLITISKTGEEKITIQNQIEISALSTIEYINKVDEFVEKFNHIHRALQVRMMGINEDLQIKEKIEQLRHRLEKEDGFNEEINRKLQILEGLASGRMKNQFVLN